VSTLLRIVSCFDFRTGDPKGVEMDSKVTCTDEYRCAILAARTATSRKFQDAYEEGLKRIAGLELKEFQMTGLKVSITELEAALELAHANTRRQLKRVAELEGKLKSYETVGAAAGHQLQLWMTRADKAEVALKLCSVELAYLIEQTQSREGGSVDIAYQESLRVLADAQEGGE